MAIINVKTQNSGFPFIGKLDKAAWTLDTSSATPDFELWGVGRLRKYGTGQSSQVQQDAEIRKRVEALAPVANKSARLALPFGTGIDQVRYGDEVLQSDNGLWYKFTGSAAADVADDTKWKSITPAVTGGRYVGTAATYATLPTTFEGSSLLAKDAAFLSADVIGTGTALAPQYSRGWYRWDGTNYVSEVKESTGVSPSETISLASLPADTWTKVTATLIASVTDVAIRSATGELITTSLQRRIVTGGVELRSDTALTNLNITVFA